MIDTDQNNEPNIPTDYEEHGKLAVSGTTFGHSKGKVQYTQHCPDKG